VAELVAATGCLDVAGEPTIEEVVAALEDAV
jgi:hypothetical protein